MKVSTDRRKHFGSLRRRLHYIHGSDRFFTMFCFCGAVMGAVHASRHSLNVVEVLASSMEVRGSNGTSCCSAEAWVEGSTASFETLPWNLFRNFHGIFQPKWKRMFPRKLCKLPWESWTFPPLLRITAEVTLTTWKYVTKEVKMLNETPCFQAYATEAAIWRTINRTVTTFPDPCKNDRKMAVFM